MSIDREEIEDRHFVVDLSWVQQQLRGYDRTKRAPATSPSQTQKPEQTQTQTQSKSPR